MDLFVVNRHLNVDQVSQEQEQANLDAVLKRIERNKATRERQKSKQKEVKAAQLYNAEQRQKKRKKNLEYIKTPENAHAEYIDGEIVDAKSSEVARPEPKPITGFTVLGTEHFAEKKQVKRVLPKWLQCPEIVSGNLHDLQGHLNEINELSPKLRNLLIQQGIEHLFPIQMAIIPYLLQCHRHADVIFPRDVCVSAPTGSGKTLSYVLPTIQTLKRHKIKRIRALVVVPTQNLALQVLKTYKMYAQNTGLYVAMVTGMQSFQNEQKQLVSHTPAFGFTSKIDILIATPGRLVDHIKLTEGFDLQHLQFLIIDEADRVLDTIQNDWLQHLNNHINDNWAKCANLRELSKPRPPQKLLFSATLSQDAEKLEKLKLYQPKLFTTSLHEEDDKNSDNFIGKYTTPKELEQQYVQCSMDLKPLILYWLIKTRNFTKILVFTHSSQSAHRLCILLQSLCKNSELKIAEICATLPVAERKQLMVDFASNKINIMICTDALARGLDFEQIQCVVSYSAPKFLKTYVHRAGRTARAGHNGTTVSLLHKTQLSAFKTMLKPLQNANLEELKVSEQDLEGFSADYERSLVQLKQTVAKEDKLMVKKAKLVKKQ